MNHKSRVDHAIVDEMDTSTKMNIENANLNTSDHLAIIIRMEIYESNEVSTERDESKTERQRISNLNWRNEKSVEKYEKALIEKLRTCKFNNAFVNEEEDQNKIDEFYSKLKNAFVEANDLITDQWSRHNSVGGNKKKLQKARLEVKLWEHADSFAKLKLAKKNFRRQQRRCVFIFEEKRNINIENLFHKPSTDKFWKSLEGFKKTSEIGINKENVKILEENIKDLFTMKTDKIVNDPYTIEKVDRVKKYEIEE